MAFSLWLAGDASNHHSCQLKTRLNGSNMFKHYPTLLGGVGRCLISVGLCWMLECSNESNTIQQYWISVPGTKLWRIFDQANENVGRCWVKRLNNVKLHPTPSNMFNCAVQMGPTCCVQQCFIMFDQQV